MTISLRSIRVLFSKVTPGRSVEYAAVEALRSHLEGEAAAIITRASSVHDRENFLRSQLGERRKVRLSPKHIRMAISDGLGGRGGGQG